MASAKDLHAGEIIQLLNDATDESKYGIMKIVFKRASVKELLAAMQFTNSFFPRALLIELLRQKRAKSAVPTLLKLVEDSNGAIRGYAVGALEEIGDRGVAPLLFQRFIRDEPSVGVQGILAGALGELGYRPAIPAFTEALMASTDARLRLCVAWALLTLEGSAVFALLSEAYAAETDEITKRSIRLAIDEIEKPDNPNQGTL